MLCAGHSNTLMNETRVFLLSWNLQFNCADKRIIAVHSDEGHDTLMTCSQERPPLVVLLPLSPLSHPINEDGVTLPKEPDLHTYKTTTA